MDAENEIVPVEERRLHPRVRTDGRKVPAAVRFADGTIQEFQLVTRNVSRGGIALMHDHVIPPGTRCQVVLPLRDGSVMGVEGEVMNCRSLGLMVQELGVAFDAPLDDGELELIALVDG